MNGTYTTDCPACGYPGALRITEKGDRILVHCFSGCPQDAVLGALRDLNLWPDKRGREDRMPGKPPGGSGTAAQADRIRLARELWGKCRDLIGSPAERYLNLRGLIGPFPPTLAFLPKCLHTPSGRRLPCLLGGVALWPSRSVTAVHRTYLEGNGEGKAKVEPAKMTLGPVGGGAVRLAAAGERLGVAEGIETSLSAQQATGIPTWAALSAGGIENLVLPDLPLASQVIIFADHDRCGLEAADKAASLWTVQGRLVRIVKPPLPGQDFNDLLMEKTSNEK